MIPFLSLEDQGVVTNPAPGTEGSRIEARGQETPRHPAASIEKQESKAERKRSGHGGMFFRDIIFRNLRRLPWQAVSKGIWEAGRK
jgi:hypothetical protein